MNAKIDKASRAASSDQRNERWNQARARTLASTRPSSASKAATTRLSAHRSIARSNGYLETAGASPAGACIAAAAAASASTTCGPSNSREVRIGAQVESGARCRRSGPTILSAEFREDQPYHITNRHRVGTAQVCFGSKADKPSRAKIHLCPLWSKCGQTRKRSNLPLASPTLFA